MIVLISSCILLLVIYMFYIYNNFFKGKNTDKYNKIMNKEESSLIREQLATSFRGSEEQRNTLTAPFNNRLRNTLTSPLIGLNSSEGLRRELKRSSLKKFEKENGVKI